MALEGTTTFRIHVDSTQGPEAMRQRAPLDATGYILETIDEAILAASGHQGVPALMGVYSVDVIVVPGMLLKPSGFFDRDDAAAYGDTHDLVFATLLDLFAVAAQHPTAYNSVALYELGSLAPFHSPYSSSSHGYAHIRTKADGQRTCEPETRHMSSGSVLFLRRTDYERIRATNGVWENPLPEPIAPSKPRSFGRGVLTGIGTGIWVFPWFLDVTKNSGRLTHILGVFGVILLFFVLILMGSLLNGFFTRGKWYPFLISYTAVCLLPFLLLFVLH